MTAFVETYPHPYHPVVDDEPDTSHTVEVFQLRAGDWSRLIGWAGGTGMPLADGGLILTDETEILGRMALGDYAVKDGDTVTVYPADGFYALYRSVPDPE